MARISQTRSSKTIKASGAVTATGQSAVFDEGSANDISVMLDVTAVSGTSPSMTVSVQWSNDGVTWFNADPADAFTAITAAGKVVKWFTVKGLYARLNYAITGTTPSFTFAAYSIYGD
jgi:hypothetical protein